jgi:hypothetical protein
LTAVPRSVSAGEVSLENNGGFVQVNLDLAPGGTLDAEGIQGLRLLVRGNGATYNVHLKTPATMLPWQSYRAAFDADGRLARGAAAICRLQPHRLSAGLDTRRLRRLGIVAIGARCVPMSASPSSDSIDPSGYNRAIINHQDLQPSCISTKPMKNSACPAPCTSVRGPAGCR